MPDMYALVNISRLQRAGAGLTDASVHFVVPANVPRKTAEIAAEGVRKGKGLTVSPGDTLVLSNDFGQSWLVTVERSAPVEPPLVVQYASEQAEI